MRLLGFKRKAAGFEPRGCFLGGADGEEYKEQMLSRMVLLKKTSDTPFILRYSVREGGAGWLTKEMEECVCVCPEGQDLCGSRR